jgi:hypothetical protein
MSPFHYSLWGTWDMYHCLSTIRAIGHRDGSPSVTAQETGQSGQPQEAEEAPFAGVIVIPGLGARHGWRLADLPGGRLCQRHRGRNNRYESR